jgi:hypothetical protein
MRTPQNFGRDWQPNLRSIEIETQKGILGRTVQIEIEEHQRRWHPRLLNRGWRGHARIETSLVRCWLVVIEEVIGSLPNFLEDF